MSAKPPQTIDDYLTAQTAPRTGASQYDPIIEKHAQRTGLDPDLIRRVIHQESGGRSNAVSPMRARGLMQLMPDTARSLGVKNADDPDENVRGGTDYLKQQLDKFKNPDLALAAYNAGPGAVEKHGNKIPPYRETQNYVKTVLNGYTGTGYGKQQTVDDYLSKETGDGDIGSDNKVHIRGAVRSANGPSSARQLDGNQSETIDEYLANPPQQQDKMAAPVGPTDAPPVGSLAAPTGTVGQTRPRIVDERAFRQHLRDQKIPLTTANLNKYRPELLAPEPGRTDEFAPPPPGYADEQRKYNLIDDVTNRAYGRMLGQITQDRAQERQRRRVTIQRQQAQSAQADKPAGWRDLVSRETQVQPENALRMPQSGARSGLVFDRPFQMPVPGARGNANSQIPESQQPVIPDPNLGDGPRPVPVLAPNVSGPRTLADERRGAQIAAQNPSDSMERASKYVENRAAVNRFIENATPGLQSLNTPEGISTGIPEHIASQAIKDATLGAFDFKVNPRHFQNDKDRELAQHLGTVTSFVTSLMPYMAASKAVGVARSVPAIGKSLGALESAGVSGRVVSRMIQSVATFAGVKTGQEFIADRKGIGEPGALKRIGEEALFGAALGGLTPEGANRALQGGIFGVTSATKAALTGEEAPVKITGNKLTDTALFNTALGILMGHSKEKAPEASARGNDAVIENQTNQIARDLMKFQGERAPQVIKKSNAVREVSEQQNGELNVLPDNQVVAGKPDNVSGRDSAGVPLAERGPLAERDAQEQLPEIKPQVNEAQNPSGVRSESPLPAQAASAGETQNPDGSVTVTAYHGSPRKGLTELLPSTAEAVGEGVYFATDPNEPHGTFGENGQVYQADVTLKKPWRGEPIKDEAILGTKTWQEYAKKEQIDPEDNIDPWGLISDPDAGNAKVLNKVLRELGYDGAILESPGLYGQEVVAFDKGAVTLEPTGEEPPHHSALQPRNESGQFDGPPESVATPIKGDEAKNPSNEALLSPLNAQESKPLSREALKTAVQTHFKLPEDQADAVSLIADARAEAWASQSGKPKEEWYKTRIAGITSGGESGKEALFQAKKVEPEKNLIVAHNLSEHNLLFANKMGGLAMPSLGITTKDSGFNGFGDITLLADKSLADPKSRVPVTDADMYSPRYPQAKYDINDKQLEVYWKDVSDTWEKTYGKEALPEYRRSGAYQHYSIADSLKDDGSRALENNQMVAARFLREKGYDLPKDPSDLMETVRTGPHKAEFVDYVESLTDGMTTKLKFFKGFTNSGNRSYRDYTLDNVVRDMKSNMKEGEGFFYGAGSVRSKAAKRYRSIEQIQKDRGRIVPEAELAGVKDEMNTRLIQLAEENRDNYKYDSGRFGFIDEFAKAVAEGAQKRNLSGALREYGFENVDTAPIYKYLDDLRSLPTEYFEAKPQRAVGLHEFEAAVVPDNISAHTRKLLESKGIDITEYKAGDSADRTRAINEATAKKASLLFQDNKASTEFLDDGRAVIRGLQAPDVSSAVHELGHVFRRDLDGPDLSVAENWAGVKDGKWEVPHEEKFARGFERYLRNGEAPTTQLGTVFAKFKDWLTNIYAKVRGSEVDINISPEMRKVFDRLLGASESAKAEPTTPLKETSGNAQPSIQGEVEASKTPKSETIDDLLTKEKSNALSQGNLKEDSGVELPRPETRADVPENTTEAREGSRTEATPGDSSINGRQVKPVSEPKAQTIDDYLTEQTKPKERSLPKTLEAAQMEKGENLTYDPISLDESEAAGRALLKEKGVDGVIERVLHGDPGHEIAPAAFAALEEMTTQEKAATAKGDTEAATAVNEKRRKFAGDLAAKFTELGQTINAVRTIQNFAPDQALYLANKLSQKARKRGLSAEEDANIGKEAEVNAEQINALKAIDAALKEREAAVAEREGLVTGRELQLAAAKKRRSSGRVRIVKKNGEAPGVSLSEAVMKRGGVRTDGVNDGEWEGTKKLVRKDGRTEEDLALALAEDGYGVGEWAFPSGEGSAATTTYEIDIDRFRQAVQDDHIGRKPSYTQEDMANIDWAAKYADYQKSEREAEDADHVVSLLENESTGGLYDKIVNGEANTAEIAEFKRTARETGLSDEATYKLVESARPGGLSPDAAVSKQGRSSREAKPKPAKVDYQTKLEQKAEEVKATLKLNLGKLNLGKMELPTGKPVPVGEKGAVRVGIPALQGDAELLAQYAAGRLGKLKTVKELNRELMDEFGSQVEPHLPEIRQRAFELRKQARLEALETSATSPKERKTILFEIQQEIAEARKAIRDAENADTTKVYGEGRAAEKKLEEIDKAWQDLEKSGQSEAEKATKRAELQQQRRDAREEVKKARAEKDAADAVRKKEEAQFTREQRQQAIKGAENARKQEVVDRQAMVDEARARLKQVRQERVEASKAEVKGYRESLKQQRQDERTAKLWDTPIRNAAAEARTRLVDADPKAPETLNDLSAVMAEKILPKETGGAPRKGGKALGEVYSEMKAEFPELVTDKNKEQIFKQAYEQVNTMTKAAREAARLRGASAETQKLWEQAGIDIDTQALLIQKSERTAKLMESNRRMAEHFDRVSRSRTRKVVDEVLSLPRALQSSVDAPLGRQGLFDALTHPVDTARYTIPATLRGYSALKRGDYHRLTGELESHPYYEMAKKFGVDLPDIIGEAGSKFRAEEDFASTWAEKLPHVRLSEQGFTLGMNTARINAFARYARIGEAEGYTPQSNPEFFKAVAKFVNNASGRGNMPDAIKNLTAITNHVFYSTRLNVSRVQLLADLFNPLMYGKSTRDLFYPDKFAQPEAVLRRIKIKETLRMAASLAAILTSAHMLGLKATLNPEDSDFGKVVWGNTRYDITGGNAGVFRFLFRELKSIYKMSTRQEIGFKQDPISIGLAFARQKLAPWPSAVIDWLYGKNSIGQPANLSFRGGTQEVLNKNIAIRMLVPMMVSDYVDVMAEDGWLKGTVKTLPSLAGIGSSTYEPTDRSGLVMGGMQKSGEAGQKVTDELKRLGIEKIDTSARAKIGDDEKQTVLSDEQRKEMAAKMTPRLLAEIQKQMNRPGYQKLSDKQKAQVLKEVVQSFKRDSLDEFKGSIEKQRRNLKPGVTQ